MARNDVIEIGVEVLGPEEVEALRATIEVLKDVNEDLENRLARATSGLDSWRHLWQRQRDECERLAAQVTDYADRLRAVNGESIRANRAESERDELKRANSMVFEANKRLQIERDAARAQVATLERFNRNQSRILGRIRQALDSTADFE